MTDNQWMDGARGPLGAARSVSWPVSWPVSRFGSRLGPFAVATAMALGMAGCDEPDPEGPAPWEGTLRDGVVSMQAKAEAGDFDEAFGVADRILAPDRFALFRQRLGVWTGGASESALRPVTWALDLVGVDALLDADRGEVEYARGQVEFLQGAAEEDARPEGEDSGVFGHGAEPCMERARAAGGAVRPDALTVMGTIWLMRAEEVRATIPEIAQANGQGGQPGAQIPGFPAAAPGAPAAPGADEEEEKDPIKDARSRYRLAKKPLIERLQFHLEGDDPKSETLATTRAHLELIARRLRELDEIEKQRQEQEDQEQENEDKQDDKGDPKDDESEKDQEPKDGEPEDGEPGDEEPEGEPEEEESEAPPEEEQSEEQEQEQQSEPQIEEKNLTEEELARFLEQVKKDREEGEERRSQLIKKRKTETQRDW